MNLVSKPNWLSKPVDVIIVPSVPGTSGGGGFYSIVANDFYEDTQEFNKEELVRFSDMYEAMNWLLMNDYNPIEFGREDGIFRHARALEWFYDRYARKAARTPLKQHTEAVRLSPVQEKLIIFLAA